MECDLIWIENLDLEKGKYQKIGGFREVDTAKDRVSWMELEILQMVEEQRSLIGSDRETYWAT